MYNVFCSVINNLTIPTTSHIISCLFTCSLQSPVVFSTSCSFLLRTNRNNNKCGLPFRFRCIFCIIVMHTGAGTEVSAPQPSTDTVSMEMLVFGWRLCGRCGWCNGRYWCWWWTKCCWRFDAAATLPLMHHPR